MIYTEYYIYIPRPVGWAGLGWWAVVPPPGLRASDRGWPRLGSRRRGGDSVGTGPSQQAQGEAVNCDLCKPEETCVLCAIMHSYMLIVMLCLWTFNSESKLSVHRVDTVLTKYVFENIY